MKVPQLLPAVLLAAGAVNGHGMWQKIKVNGQDQGQNVGIRPSSSNNPVQNVNGNEIACNTNLLNPVSNKVIQVPAGAQMSAWFQHVIGGPQFANDPDNPIAPSHKGPISVYMAKVDNAGTASAYNSYSWFKIAEEGLNTGSGKWAVDTMIGNQGWWDFTMPSCIAPGQYLMRVELLALHSAYSAGGAQFYMSCANIEVTGSGTKTGSNLVKFPGAYPSNDAGIVINIYSGTPSLPNNGGKAYKIPGPPKLTC
ncbi:Endoglucanase II [Venustampulla echinocandica]|uniref:AA9 family lytic polysaccharide monooxygenase n=1 Tax=Venustampulla echinocandica TaxID=2656787 RepID=A0A370TEQ0_9HELO|nr:Endoglucanase II [Venustampulla echinocandica]RDL33174.1 Endoglucanase II [Venustampulla echinocandica]